MPILPLDRALRLNLPQVGDVLALIESLPADRGISVLVRDFSGGGGASVIEDIAARITGWQTIHATALPWHRNTPGAFLSTLPELRPQTVVLIEDSHHLDDDSARRLRELTLSSARLVVLAVTGPSEVTDVLYDVPINIPPLPLSAIAQYADTAFGTTTRPETVLSLRARSAGRLDLLRELVVDASVEVPVRWVADLEAVLESSENPQNLRQWLAIIAVGSGASSRSAAPAPAPVPVDTVREIGRAWGLSDVGLDEGVEMGVVGVGKQGLFFTDPRHRAAALVHVAPSRLNELQEATGLAGNQEAADRYLADGRWEAAAREYRMLAMDDPDAVKPLIKSLVSAGELPEARIWTRRGALPVEESYLAMHEGRRLHAHSLVKDANGPAADIQRTFLALADWDAKAMRTHAEAIRASVSPDSPERAEADLMSTVATSISDGIRRPLPALSELVGSTTDGLIRQHHRMLSGWLSLAADDPLTARETLRGDDLGENRHDIVRVWQDAWLARTHYVLGEFSDARRVVEQGLSRAERHGTALLNPVLLWTGAQVAAFQGDPALSKNYLSRLPRQRSSDDAFIIQRLPAAMCRMIVTANSADLPSAIRAGEVLAAIGMEKDTRQPGFWPWEDVYAQCLVRAGRISAADQVVTDSEARIAMSGLDSVKAKMLVPRGSILLRRGFVDEGLRCFETAAGLMEDSPMLAYRSRILLEYGQVLRRLGRRNHAEGVFARAEEVFEDMDAVAMVERTRRERRISGTGASAETGGITGVTGDAPALTPQEEQIALMVADGVTNREVARELTLSTKTIEHHLTRVYKKLGIRGRSELAAALRV